MKCWLKKQKNNKILVDCLRCQRATTLRGVTDVSILPEFVTDHSGEILRLPTVRLLLTVQG